MSAESTTHIVVNSVDQLFKSLKERDHYVEDQYK